MYGITHGSAGLDEEVVSRAADVALDQVELLADDAQQAAQRVAVLGVLLAIDGGQELVEPVGARGSHQALPPWRRR